MEIQKHEKKKKKKKNNKSKMDVESDEEKMEYNNSLKNEKEKTIEQNNIKIDYNIKDMILTQDILEGSWDLNSQTKLFIKNNKEMYDKAQKYFKSLDCKNEKIIITFIVIKYLMSINQKEHILIIQKGIQFLKDNNFDYYELVKYL